MNVREIKDRLNGRVLEVCEMLLPTGRQENGKWVCGDATGKEGSSLKVNLSGPYVGTFHDFADNSPEKSGDLIKLWQLNRNMEFGAALDDIKRYLGIQDEAQDLHRSLPRQRRLQPGVIPNDWRPVQEGSRVWKWLTDVRKLKPETIRDFEIGEFEGKHWDGNDHCCVVFPYREMLWRKETKQWARGQCVLIKYRDIDDKAYQRTAPKLSEGGRTILFGMQLVPNEGRDLVITEGEFDAMALFQLGLPAVSIPFGAQPAKDGELSEAHRRWLEECHDWMERFEEVYLAFDNDEAGQAGARSVAPRVGLERVRILLMPGGLKDGNEALQAGVTTHEISQAAREAKGFDPEELKTPLMMLREIYERVFPEKAGTPVGDELPWALPFRLRQGEVTVVHGYNAHGKTVLLSFVLVWLAATHGRRSVIASLEMPSSITFQNLLRQTFGRPCPSDEEELREWLQWLSRYFWAYDHVGEVEVGRLLDVWRYAARKYGVQYFVLDSLMKVAGLEGEDLEGQKDLLNKLLEFAAKEQVHVFLVCHSKKPDSRHPENKNWPGKYDISGSGNISNLAWNVWCVWRNREKEEQLYRVSRLPDGDATRTEVEEKWRGVEDAMFIVQKQRLAGAEPLRRLWFHHGEAGSWRYSESPSFDVSSYVDSIGRAAAED